MDECQIRSLMREDAFPHPVASLELLETHISWVILTGDYAYKIKKPVALEFLDFSTAEARRHYCEEELRLNRRLAAELYLDVADIRASPEGPRIGGTGAVLDAAVKMRQFDQHRLASRAADDGRLTIAQCRTLGKTIAEFHNGLEPVTPGPDDAVDAAGTPTAIFRAAQQNFEQIREALPAAEDRDVLAGLEAALGEDYERVREYMWERLDGGFVRECHGDLHLGNVVLLDDRALPFDCIEFNPDFRLVDIQCEIGFPVMDLDSRELPGHANRVLNSWLEYTGDYEGLRLHTFYDVYLAMVRAKISLLGALAADADDVDLADYRRYLSLAAAGRRRLPRFLCITMGVSGSGKSTVAESLAAEFSAIRLRSDVERKRLFGLAPEEGSAMAGPAEQIYGRETSDRVFTRLEAMAEAILDAGLPVIVDATFIEASRRRPFLELATRRGLPFVIMQCLAGEAELERRLAARKKHDRDASEADIDIMRRQIGRVDAPGREEIDHLVVVDTEASRHIEKLVNAVERRITKR